MVEPVSPSPEKKTDHLPEWVKQAQRRRERLSGEFYSVVSNLLIQQFMLRECWVVVFLISMLTKIIISQICYRY